MIYDISGIKLCNMCDENGWTAAQRISSALYGSTAAEIERVFDILFSAVFIWGIIEIGFLRGTPGPNRHGPDPLAATNTEGHPRVQ